MKFAPHSIVFIILLCAPAPSAGQSAPPRPADSVATSRAASSPAGWFDELKSKLAGGPFYAVFSLKLDGPLGETAVLRVHGRAAGHLLIQIAGSERLRGNTFLLYKDSVYLWFPRAQWRVVVRRGGLSALSDLLFRESQWNGARAIYFERNPPTPESLFLPESLEQWR
ncbi:MAG: hypothetical protein HY286_01860 [Planctomycetes bacterium]|nr:hypothetical protein [Planctomycetota bacterium]